MPYGEAIIDEHNTDYENPFKFTGTELDPTTGLYDHGARQRNPIHLNWLNPDPLTEKFPGVSPWSYCHANPVGWIDLNGEEPSPEEAARMDDYVYGNKPNSIFAQTKIGVFADGKTNFISNDISNKKGLFRPLINHLMDTVLNILK